jgi:hypothetical protein
MDCPKRVLLDNDISVTEQCYYRKVIRIRAEDSPNVARGLEMRRRGLKADGSVVLPGVLSLDDYDTRRKMWDQQRQKVGLDGDFWEGQETLLVPQDWLDAAVRFAKVRPKADTERWMGMDSGEGGDDSCWVINDRFGILHVLSLKTPDTNVCYGMTLELMRQWNVKPDHVVFDLGGGGREHAHRLRASGYQVRAVGFGKAPSVDPKRSTTQFVERRDVKEDQYAYVNRRSEMYYDFRLLLERDKDGGFIKAFDNPLGFALPSPMCDELIRQISVVPLTTDGEGRFKLIPKQNPDDPKDPMTFKYLIGRSPDQADAFACSLYGMTHKPIKTSAGGW